MAIKDAKLELLHSVPLFSTLKSKELLDLGQLSDEIDLPRGRVLMRQGDKGSEAFVIVTGSATVERDGQEIARVGPGDVVGEIAVLSEGPRTATVTLLEPSTLFVLTHGAFHVLLEDSPEVRRCVFDELARRIRTLDTTRAH
jgi:CRP/FNR family cyclic AMP-dependent transcriptional regulator